MFSLIAIAFLLKRYGTQAVPLPAPTPASSTFEAPVFARDTPSDGSQSRTVLDILWSCLATTFACTWVSVHPNVPFDGEGKWTLLRRRIFLMFFSILLPEFMIMWAFKQWRGAVMIRKAINKTHPESDWTMTHSHFLQMGGFRFKSNIAGKGRVLKFKRFKKYLRDGRINFPSITEDEINDRSKGDALSKGIAFLQLTWFVAQIIARAAQGLAITELELTTATLAGLNSVMYIFWWSKPRDVRFPIVIRTNGAEELQVKRTNNVSQSFRRNSPRSDSDLDRSPNDLRPPIVAQPSGVRDLQSPIVSQHTRTRTNEDNGAAEFVKRLDIALITIARCALHISVLPFSMLIYGINCGFIMPISQILNSDSNAEFSIPMVFDAHEQLRVFSMMFYSENTGVRLLLSTSSISGALFGGVHCLAWHFSFPSHAEQIIWRTASLGVVLACTLSFVGTFIFIDFEDFVDNIHEGDLIGRIAYAFLTRFLLLLVLLPSLAYIVARFLLLVIALTALRSLPSSAFDTVDWIKLLPHI